MSEGEIPHIREGEIPHIREGEILNNNWYLEPVFHEDDATQDDSSPSKAMESDDAMYEKYVVKKLFKGTRGPTSLYHLCCLATSA